MAAVSRYSYCILYPSFLVIMVWRSFLGNFIHFIQVFGTVSSILYSCVLVMIVWRSFFGPVFHTLSKCFLDDGMAVVFRNSYTLFIREFWSSWYRALYVVSLHLLVTSKPIHHPLFSGRYSSDLFELVMHVCMLLNYPMFKLYLTVSTWHCVVQYTAIFLF